MTLVRIQTMSTDEKRLKRTYLTQSLINFLSLYIIEDVDV